jgi:hypothetical protein
MRQPMRWGGLRGLTAVLLVVLAAAAPHADAQVRLFGTQGFGEVSSTLVELDQATGAIVQTIGPVGYIVNGLDYDPVTGKLFGGTSYRDPNFNGLIEIDMSTGAGTPVGAANWGRAGAEAITNITVNSAGQMFGWSEWHDSLVSIDSTTGVASDVGPSSISTWQYGLSFDSNDVLYLVNGDGVVYTVNTTTGAATAYGSIGTPAHHGDFHPETDRYYGLTTTGPPRELLSADLAAGTFTVIGEVGNLHTLAFMLDPTLKKTVGTTAGVCAATSTITVAPGTTVYYCYTFTNTSDDTLDLHTLVDDQLGTIFSGLSYVLAPGASIDTVTAGLSIPAVITTTTTNVATWTASVTDGPTLEGVATATVNTVQPADVTGSKTVSGLFIPGGNIVYTIVLSNAGPGEQGDNPGDEFTDVLPAQLAATSVVASSGTAQLLGNTVTWNGAIPAGGSVTITIAATIAPGTSGVVVNQGEIAYDSVGDSVNDAIRLTDDPTIGGTQDPTAFAILAAIPTLQGAGLALLILALAGIAIGVLRRIT